MFVRLTVSDCRLRNAEMSEGIAANGVSETLRVVSWDSPLSGGSAVTAISFKSSVWSWCRLFSEAGSCVRFGW